MGSILSRVTLTPGLTESPFRLNCGYGGVKADAAQVRREVGAAAFLPDKMQACWFSCRVPASLIDGNYLLLFLSLLKKERSQNRRAAILVILFSCHSRIVFFGRGGHIC